VPADPDKSSGPLIKGHINRPGKRASRKLKNQKDSKLESPRKTKMKIKRPVAGAAHGPPNLLATCQQLRDDILHSGGEQFFMAARHL
jgi:hypothetical protein